MAIAKVTNPEMIRLPGGTFLMGSPAEEPERREDEEQHQVIVKSFHIGKYAVTFDEFDAFARDVGRDLPLDFGWGRGRRPVVGVTWHEATEYAAWLSRKTGKHYRLPTEAEWEYAARAGTTTAYWWGTEPDRNRANYWKGDVAEGTVAVDTYEANPWGIYNILGNTWEWTGSLYRARWDGSEARCAGPEERGLRVARGGSWDDSPELLLRSACRRRTEATDALDTLGFRLARGG